MTSDDNLQTRYNYVKQMSHQPRALGIAKMSLLGAFYGFAAWFVYGLIEMFLYSVVPLALGAGDVLGQRHWYVTAILFAGYAATGISLGALGGGLLAVAARVFRRADAEPDPHKLAQIAASLTLVLSYTALLLMGQFSGRGMLPLCAGLAVCLLACIPPRPWRQQLGFLAGPWTSGALLVVVPYVNYEIMADRSAIARGAASLLAVLGLMGVSALIHRAVHWLRQPTPFHQTALLGMGTLAVVVMVGAFSKGLDVPGRLAPANAVSGRPNVVLIVLDTVHAGHLSLYGYARNTTPNLKQLAAEATVYEHAASVSDHTLPTHGSLFTGLYPSWHGAHYTPKHSKGRPLSGNALTMAELLRDKGYSTMAVVANSHYVGPSFGMDQGFAAFDCRKPVLAINPFGKRYFLRHAFRRILGRIVSTGEWYFFTRTSSEINAAAFALLDKARDERTSFFLFVNYMDAHGPYVPTSPYDTLFEGKNPRFSYPNYLDLVRNVFRPGKDLPEHVRRHLISQYDGGIAQADAAIGELVSKLKRMGAYDNTLFIVTADHGEAFGARHLLGHGMGELYSDLTHIPLLIKFPGTAQTQSVKTPVSQVDVLPTVLDVLGYETPKNVQGRSLRQGSLEPRAVFAEAFPAIGIHVKAILAGDRKLIMHQQDTIEVFDVVNDPSDSNNLYKTGSAEMPALRAALEDWYRSRPRLPDQAPAKVTKEELERLKSLGYVQ
mgnify:CR=1 FL=1